jgi:hypothetical protein
MGKHLQITRTLNQTNAIIPLRKQKHCYYNVKCHEKVNIIIIKYSIGQILK